MRPAQPVVALPFADGSCAATGTRLACNGSRRTFVFRAVPLPAVTRTLMAAPPLAPAEAPPLHASGDRPRQARVPHLSSVQPPEPSVEPSARPVVLLAEDHEDSRDALRTLLDAFGYRVVEAVNGRQAVERAREESPDVILMDMMMPVMDGLQATRELRALPAFRDVPIVALTAMEGARESVLAAGCSDMVAKPIDVRSFLEKMRVWVRARPAA